MGLFNIINKVIKVLYRLDLLLKIKIYLVYYITILKLVYKNHKLLIIVILLFILFIVRCGSLISLYRLYLLLQGKSSCALLEAKTSQIYKKNTLPKANFR